MRSDLVDDEHAGYCNAIEEMITKFKAVTHIGGCCGCGPEGIQSLKKNLLHK